MTNDYYNSQLTS